MKTHIALNKVVALEKGTKEGANKALGEAFRLAKEGQSLFHGQRRVYHPYSEDDQPLPDEVQQVRMTVKMALERIKAALGRHFDVTATRDGGNTRAVADIVIDDVAIAAGVSVPHLLFLEKQLEELHKLFTGLPLLDQGENWTKDEGTGLYRSEPTTKVRTRKVPKVVVKYEATKEHPAQTEMITEDIPAGEWKTTLFSGALTVDEKNAAIARVLTMLNAVRMAREEANSTDVEFNETGRDVLSYVIGDLA